MPSTGFMAASMSLALRSGILIVGDLADLVAGDPADASSRAAVARALLDAGGLAEQVGGGRRAAG